MSQFSILESSNSAIALSPTIAWFLVGFLGLFFVVASFILSYHWKKFGVETFVMARASLLYFAVSAVLLLIMVASLVFYLNSL